jgi:site-specific recombinase XerC
LARAPQTSSIRVRLATLSSFGKWAVRQDTIARNPVDVLTLPRRKARLPRVRQWDTVKRLSEQRADRREMPRFTRAVTRAAVSENGCCVIYAPHIRG